MVVSRKGLFVVVLALMTNLMYSQKTEKFICNSSGIDVYEKADIKSKVVVHIPFGESVVVSERTDIEVQNEGKGFWWLKISYNKVSGYVSSKYLVNSFETVLKVQTIEGIWVRNDWKSKDLPPEGEYLSFVYSGRNEKPLFIVNEETEFTPDTETEFSIYGGDMGFYYHEEHYVYKDKTIYCHVEHRKSEIEYDEDGIPTGDSITIEKYEKDYVYKKTDK
ncbi:MAG: SH3 domain-containing protein [Treponema sp.]|nr:SH3 domain-containing protein [Treponema sp.]